MSVQTSEKTRLEVLREELAKEEAAENRRIEKEKKEYDKAKDHLIKSSFAVAVQIASELQIFKKILTEEMEAQQQRLNEYGSIRANSKGGFSIKSSDGNLKLTRSRCTTPEWNEKSIKAVELIKDFLQDTVKKKDLNLYEILISFIQRNKKGDLEYAQVMNLVQHEDKYKDPRWIEGLKLIKESYHNELQKYSYQFHKKNKEGKWENLNLNFSAL